MMIRAAWRSLTSTSGGTSDIGGWVGAAAGEVSCATDSFVAALVSRFSLRLIELMVISAPPIRS